MKVFWSFSADKKAIKKLILQDVDLNVMDQNGRTPIFIACKSGHADFVELLANNGADVNHHDNRGFTPISVAVQNCKICLDATTYLHENDEMNFLAFSGRKNVVEALVKNGADINAKNDLGMNALHIAVNMGEFKPVQSALFG